MQFFKLVVDGQRKLREMWKQEVERQRKAERLRNKKENAELEAEGIEADNTAQYNEDQQYEQQIVVKSNDCSFVSIPVSRNSIVLYNPNIVRDVIILVMPDGSIYAAEHEMSLQMEGLTKPRKKRGRPPKVHTESDASVRNFRCFVTSCNFYVFFSYICILSKSVKENSVETASQDDEDKQEEEIEDVDGDGRRRRRRKVPKRYTDK